MLAVSTLLGLFILATQLQTWEFEFEPKGDAWSVKVKLKYFYMFTFVDEQIENIKYVAYIGKTGPNSTSSLSQPRFRWSGLVAMKSDEQYHQISRILQFQSDIVVQPYMDSLLQEMNKGQAFKSKLDIPFDLNPITGIGFAFLGAGILGILLLLVAKMRGISVQ